MAKRRLIGGLILSLALTTAIAYDPPTTAVIGTPPQPSWGQLSVQQKNVLSPLRNDWDKMEDIRRKKWLGVAERYPKMKPDEQERMQNRMREWASLTPAQRAKIRDSYKDFNQLPPEQKKVVKKKWEAYSNLPSDEKQRVREQGKSATLLTPPASPIKPENSDALPAQSADQPVADTAR